MKTSNEPEIEWSENGMNSRLNHKSFLQHTIKSSSVKAKKIIRDVDKANYSILTMLGMEDYTTKTKVSIHPEFVAYAFHLYGLSRKLFLYIIFFELNNDTCRFIINDAMLQRFAEFCSLFGEEENDKTIQQAIRSLIRKNTMIGIDPEEYMLNPLIAGGSTEYKRRKLIDFYTELLTKKGLDPSVDFYPKYQLTL